MGTIRDRSSSRPARSSPLPEPGPDPVLEQGQGGTDGHVHVEVLVAAEAAAEEDTGLRGGQFPVAQQAGTVLGGVDRVVGLVVAAGEPWVLARDDGAVVGVVAPLGVVVAE